MSELLILRCCFWQPLLLRKYLLHSNLYALVGAALSVGSDVTAALGLAFHNSLFAYCSNLGVGRLIAQYSVLSDLAFALLNLSGLQFQGASFLELLSLICYGLLDRNSLVVCHLAALCSNVDGFGCVTD